MPTATFTIQSYRVHVSQNRSTPIRIIELSSTVLFHGIQNSAVLVFSPIVTELAGIAHNIGGLNFDGITIYANLPFDNFESMYDVLRNEAPMQLFYSYEEGESISRPLLIVSLMSGEEPPGEGPKDVDSVNALIASVSSIEVA